MFGERSKDNHDNYVERMLNSEDHRLKQTTDGLVVKSELEAELNKFYIF